MKSFSFASSSFRGSLSRVLLRGRTKEEQRAGNAKPPSFFFFFLFPQHTWFVQKVEFDPSLSRRDPRGRRRIFPKTAILPVLSVRVFHCLYEVELLNDHFVP